MAVRRILTAARRTLTAALLFGAICAAPNLLGSGAAGAQNLLVLPFENAGRDPRLDWIGEGLAELSSDRLAGDGRVVFSREEWLAALEKLGLPASSRFTRATMLKLAEEMDADYVVFGSFTSDGRALTATARVLRVEPLNLSAALSEAGGIEDLMELHARLAWQMLRTVDDTLPVDRNSYLASLDRIRLDAFEQYIRGLLASIDAQRTGYLREAARLAPEWSAPALVLGRDALVRRDCAGALNWFGRVQLEQRGGAEAAFYTGLCHLTRNDAARAENAFAALAEKSRIAEAFNNLGVARARQEKWREAAAAWQQAQQLDAGEADYWFNLGMAALQQNDAAAAARSFREALQRRPDDGEARGALVLALERSGRTTEAASLREEAAVRDVSRAVPRVKSRWNPPAPARAANNGHRSAHAQLHLDRGRTALAAGKLGEAQREFSEAVLLAPDSAEAHAGLAEVYERQSRTDDAIREWRAAVFGRDAAAFRIRLARLYITRKQPAEARTELRAALRAEPGNAEAKRLLESVEAGGRR